MAERTTQTPMSESCWPSKKEAFQIGLALGHSLATVDIHKMQQQPPPTHGTGWMTFRGMADGVRTLVGYFTAAHKLVLLWRAISLTYIGREALRWLGWL